LLDPERPLLDPELDPERPLFDPERPLLDPVCVFITRRPMLDPEPAQGRPPPPLEAEERVQALCFHLRPMLDEPQWDRPPIGPHASGEPCLAPVLSLPLRGLPDSRVQSQQ
jgi:hypothetical protein